MSWDGCEAGKRRRRAFNGAFNVAAVLLHASSLNAAPGVDPTCELGAPCAAKTLPVACNPACTPGYTCDSRGHCVSQAPAIYDAWEGIREEREEAMRMQSGQRHDGFYFRFGSTTGYAFDRAERDGEVTTSRGWGGFLEYAVGGTLKRGWVVGGTYNAVVLVSPTTTVDGFERKDPHDASFGTIGPFVDWFPDEHGGWHFTALFGLGIATIEPDGDEDDDTSVGFGASAGAGYDAWIGEQWSLGVMGRLLFIEGASDEFGSHRVLVPNVSLSLLYH